MSDKFTDFEVVVDRYDKEHKIYSAKMLWKKDIQRLTPRFSDINIISNILNPKISNGDVELDSDGEVVWDERAYDAMMQIVLYALDEKESLEQVLSWVDTALIRRIIEVFYDISGYKKKNRRRR